MEPVTQHGDSDRSESRRCEAAANAQTEHELPVLEALGEEEVGDEAQRRTAQHQVACTVTIEEWPDLNTEKER